MNSLQSYFTGTASKYLSAVDATPKSNQHEIGSNRFTQILGNPGSEKKRLEATFLLFAPDSDSPESCVDIVTWYDTRLNQPCRSPEYRLYYRNNPVTEQFREGDFCLVATLTSGKLLIAIARPGSQDEARLRHLFNLATTLQGWNVQAEVTNRQIDLASRQILEALGLDTAQPETVDVDALVNKFGLTFPPTKAFSALARQWCPHTSPIEEPDEALETWMRYEEAMFRALENLLVREKLRSGFSEVEDFIAFSLSVQNRRKSRVGHALEHHLSAVLQANSIRHERGAKTENNAKPDFLFPGAAQYHDARIGSPPLRMLGAKTTCKDRWRQILAEAQRIPEKHLFTLETAISSNQLREMHAHKVHLVTTPSISATYTQSVMNLREFIQMIQADQASP